MNMEFRKWFEAATAVASKSSNKLATLVQQGVGAGDRDAWQAVLSMLKNQDDTQLQTIRQLASGYLKYPGKPGAAAKYLLDQIDEIDQGKDEEHFGDKANQAVNAAQHTLDKLNVPHELSDHLLDVLTKHHDSYMSRYNVGNTLMRRVMPILVQIATYMIEVGSEKEAENAMIEILGDMTHFTPHVPTAKSLLSQARAMGV